MKMQKGLLSIATLSPLVALSLGCSAPEGQSLAVLESAASSSGPGGIVYVESNDPHEGRNAILAYTRAQDGSLAPAPGSPYCTGGTGVGNPKQAFGVDDSDQEIVATPDRRFLFAVNSGSNTIASFRIAPDGQLHAVPGSPFDSGGLNPVSLGIAGEHLVVVNKAQDPRQPSPARLPNYTVFSIASSGALRPVPGSTVETVAGASPTQALISPDGELVFGTDLLAPIAPKPSGALRSFRLDEGRLIPGPGTPEALPPDPDPTRLPVALGLAVHPTLPLLYVGFPARQQVGVYSYDPRGKLDFVTVAEGSGKAPCWLAINKAGTRFYTANTPDGTISTFDATDPRAPREIQKIALRDPGPTFINPMKVESVSSGPTQLALDPDDRVLYAVNQRITADPQVTAGNTLHALTVGADGTLTETLPDVPLPVPPETHPQGIVVF